MTESLSSTVADPPLSNRKEETKTLGIPEEMLDHIFWFLPFSTFVQTGLVCKQWYIVDSTPNDTFGVESTINSQKKRDIGNKPVSIRILEKKGRLKFLEWAAKKI